MALCPFHKEKTPSFNVNPHRQIFHCFGCHKGGDVFTFVKEYENLSFIEAVRRLAERARIPIEFDPSPGQEHARHLKDTLLSIHEQITQRWHACLTHDAAGGIARDYLAKRGVSQSAIAEFRLGYAPDAWDDTVNWARAKDHDAATVEKAGLIIRREGSDDYYDRFRGRLMFPICDEQVRVIGFSGRILTGDEKTAKYVNSPETPLFTKGRVIFGLDKAKRALLDAGFAVICEGQLDLIACHSAGVRNVVAPQGTALTAEQTRILKRYVDEVVLCFDSDTAGQKAATRSLDALLASGLAVRVATIPAPHDPDSFIREFGGDSFQKMIESAEGFFDFQLKALCATHDAGTDKGRVAILREMAEAVHKTGNQMLVDKYAQKTALHLGVSPESVRIEFKKLRSHPTPAARRGEEEESEAPEERPRPSSQEFWLLKLAFLHDDQAPFVAEHLDPRWISNDTVRKILELRVRAEVESSWTGVPGLLSALEEDDTARGLITEAVTEDRSLPDPGRQLLDLLTRLRNQFLDRQLAILTRQLTAEELEDEQRRSLFQQQQALRKTKQAPLHPLGDPH
jgi:DNA primase